MNFFVTSSWPDMFELYTVHAAEWSLHHTARNKRHTKPLFDIIMRLYEIAINTAWSRWIVMSASSIFHLHCKGTRKTQETAACLDSKCVKGTGFKFTTTSFTPCSGALWKFTDRAKTHLSPSVDFLKKISLFGWNYPWETKRTNMLCLGLFDSDGSRRSTISSSASLTVLFDA